MNLENLLAQLRGLPADAHAEHIATAVAASDTSALSAEVLTRFGTLNAAPGATISDEQLRDMELLAAVADAVRAFAAAQEAKAARAAEVTARMANFTADQGATQAPQPAPVPQDEQPATEDDGQAPTADTTPPADGAADTTSDHQTPTADTAPADASGPAGTEMSMRRRTVPIGRMPSAPAPEPPSLPGSARYSLIAAADVPGFSVGQSLAGTRDLAHAWEQRMMPLVTGSVNSGRDGDRTRVGVARIRREVDEAFSIQNDSEAAEKIEAACTESRLPGGSLVAAGGWCAPSETLYDLCPIEMSDGGMVDLPTVTARRGGLRYPPAFDWSSIWSSMGFYQTETEAIAGTPKPCAEVPCPTDMIECRMDAEGVCLRTPILMERGWPERVAQFMEGALLVHAHQMNARKIARMAELSQPIVVAPPPAPSPTAAIADPHGPGAVESFLSIIELQIQYARYVDRLPQEATMEMVAPYWLRGVLKSDLRKKLGIDNRWQVSDQMLDNYLRQVGAQPQWVYDWQDALASGVPTDFGGAVPPAAWPSEVQILLYRAGSFFQLAADVINLDGVYDHASLVENVYTGLFTEEGFQVCMRCGKSYLLTIPLCPNGLSGGAQLTTCA